MTRCVGYRLVSTFLPSTSGPARGTILQGIWAVYQEVRWGAFPLDVEVGCMWVA